MKCAQMASFDKGQQLLVIKAQKQQTIDSDFLFSSLDVVDIIIRAAAHFIAKNGWKTRKIFSIR